jgi:hypothetical protein
MAVPVFNFYTIKVRSTYDQLQNNYSAISEANSFLFNDFFSLPGHFFCYNLTGGYRTFPDVAVYIP